MSLNRVLMAAAHALRGYGAGQIQSRILQRQDTLDRATQDRYRQQQQMEAMRLSLQQRGDARAQSERDAASQYLGSHGAGDLAHLGPAGLSEYFTRHRQPPPPSPNAALEAMAREAEGTAKSIALQNTDPSASGIEALLAQQYPKLPPGRRQGIAAEAVAWAETHKNQLGRRPDPAELYRALGITPPTPVQP